MLVLADELLTDANIAVGNVLRGKRSKLLMLARGDQMFAARRAIHGVFAFRAAADGADFAAHAGAVTLRAPLGTNFARNVHLEVYPYRIIGPCRARMFT